MKFDRLVLYILGNGQESLGSEICNCVKEICDSGMDHGMRVIMYSPGVNIKAEINRLQADPLVMAAKISANRLYCVFVIDDSMSVTEWGRCITEVKKSLDAQMLANVAFTAIVQKENLNMTEMADILTKYPMKVFLYGQQCEAGNIIYGEDEQLMAQYAVLAGCNMLPDQMSVYACAFNKLNLMESDFDRIRKHYIEEALSTKTTQSQDVLFTRLFGEWAEGVKADTNAEELCDVLKKKIRPLFPSPACLALLANKDVRVAEDNVNKFIRMNYAARKSPDERQNGLHGVPEPEIELQSCYSAFLERFERTGGTISNKPESLVRSWLESLHKEKETNPDYYCDGTIDYIRYDLIDWINSKARRIRNEQMKRIRDEILNPPADAGISERAFINTTVDYVEKRLDPFVRLAAAYFLEAISRALLKECDCLRMQLNEREKIIGKYRLHNDKLTNYEFYARSIMSSIESHCETHVRPSMVMGSDAALYYDSDEMQRAWERLIEGQCQKLKDAIQITDQINNLNNMNVADFGKAIPTMLRDNGYRLMKGAQLNFAPTQYTRYVYSDRLTTVGFNGKDFPDWDPVTCSKEAVEGLNNILQFKVVELTTANMPAKDEEETDISYRLRCMAQVIKMVPNSERYKTHQETTATEVEKVETSQAVSMQAARAGTCKMAGGKLQVTLPVHLNSDVTCIINGYNDEGTIKAPDTQYISLKGSLTFDVPIKDFYGHCRLTVIGSMGTGANSTKYEETFGFDAANTPDETYKRKNGGGLFSKRQSVTVRDEDIPLKHVVFMLQGKRPIPLEVCINPDAQDPVQYKDTVLYPIGQGVKWDVYAPEDIAESMVLKANDPEGIRRISE